MQIYEEKVLTHTIETFYSEILDFEMQLLQEKEQRALQKIKFEEDEGIRMPAVGGDVDSSLIEEIKVKEPKKPSMTTADAKAEKEKHQRPEYKKAEYTLKENFAKEREFILNIHKLARNKEMTNDPKKLFDLFMATNDRKSTKIEWFKDGNPGAQKVINDFYDIKYYLKRLVLAF